MTDTTAEAATETAAAAIERLRAGYAARYGAAVFDVGLSADEEGRPVLVGEVLMASQRDQAIEAVQQALGSAVADDVIVLLEEEGAPWFQVQGRLDVRAAPEGELATQVVVGDPPIRCIAERGAWWLVELADGTVGWCRPDALAPLAAEGQPPSRDAWRAEFRGHWRAPAHGWRAAVERWLGTPYLWGGNTRQGVDCSGFVQRVVKESAGFGLPKHSVDQVRAGRRVAPDQAIAGDLIYLNRIDDGVRHVALVVDAGPPIEVAHAGRERGVAIETLDSLLARYHVRGAARLGPDPQQGSHS